MEVAKLTRKNSKYLLVQNHVEVENKISNTDVDIKEMIRESFRNKCKGENDEIDQAWLFMADDLIDENVSDLAFNASGLICEIVVQTNVKVYIKKVL